MYIHDKLQKPFQESIIQVKLQTPGEDPIEIDLKKGFIQDTSKSPDNEKIDDTSTNN